MEETKRLMEHPIMLKKNKIKRDKITITNQCKIIPLSMEVLEIKYERVQQLKVVEAI